MFGAFRLLSRKLMTDEIILSFFVTFSLPALLLVLFCPVSLYLPIVLSHSVLKKKNDFKSIFQNISGYAKVKVTDEDFYLV